jgi:3-methyladenine DNA glycosylase/8-oxoguanine DNA glycosylase
MPEAETKMLWQAIREDRETLAQIRADMQTGLAEIKAMLSERCESRMDRLKALEVRADHLQDAHEDLALTVRGLRVTLAIWAAVGSVVGGAAVAAIFRWVIK